MQHSSIIELFGYNQEQLHDHESDGIQFLVHDLYGKRVIPHLQRGSSVCVDTSLLIFDNAVTADEQSANAQIDAILDRIPPKLREEKKLWVDFLKMYRLHTDGIHDVCFAEVCMAFSDQKSFNNNFVCIVPIVRDKDQTCRALPPFHGALWEMTPEELTTFFIKKNCDAVPDAAIRVLAKTFDDRTVMKDGFSVLQPFGVARDRDLNRGEECLITKCDIYTYVSDIYAMYTNIGLSHVCMSNQELPFSLVDHVVCHALVHMTNNSEMDGVQVLASSSNPCIVDIFLTMLCFTMHSYDLGHFMYRNDVLGEDFRSRFLNDGKVDPVPISCAPPQCTCCDFLSPAAMHVL